MGAAPFLIPEGALGIAALVNVLIALLDILMLCAVLGMLWGYKHTFGALIQFIVDHTTIHTPIGSFSPFFPLELANNVIMAQMSIAALGLEKAGGLFFHSLGVIVGWMVNLAAYSATTMEHAFHWLVHVYIPGRASWAASVLFPPALITKLIRSAILKEIPHASRVAKGVAHAATVVIYRPVRAFERRLARDEALIHRLAGGAVAAVGALPSPWAFPRFRRSWHELELWRKVTARRLHKLEALLAASGLALAVANMTGTRLSCWRGQGNIVRALRHICGVPRWLIDLLILGAIEAFVVTDLCEFTDLLQAEAKTLVPVLMEFVDVEDALIGCHGTVKPLTFTLPSASLPPLQGVSPLAA